MEEKEGEDNGGEEREATPGLQAPYHLIIGVLLKYGGAEGDALGEDFTSTSCYLLLLLTLS